jgi:hypothetical protein
MSAVARWWIGWFVLLAAASASAASKSDLADRLAACAREADDAARLACYDRLAKPAAAPELVSAAPASERIDRLNATVTAITKRARGELVVTLDNGQLWLQKDSEYVPLKTGEQITILAGALGSYRLITAAGRAMAVTRIQ